MAELARLLDADGRLPDAVPARVRETVRSRLDALDPLTRELLEAGAVARQFSIAGLAHVTSGDRIALAAALDAAVAAGIVCPLEPGRFGFAHTIVREAVYEELAPARRIALHEAVAARCATARLSGGDVAAAEVADHSLAAARGGGEPQAAWESALEAAREAQAALGHAEAAERYAHALEALELGAEAPVGERLAALLALAESTFAAGDIDRPQRATRSSGRGAPRRAAETMARAALVFAQVQAYGALDEEAIELLPRARRASPERASCARG